MSKYSEHMPPDIAGAIGWVYKIVEPGSTILDFGCSTGYFGSYIKQHKNCHVYGVEISEDKKEAKKVLDGVYSFDLDSEWPAKVYEHKYDYLLFGDVLEHLKSPVDALKKSRKLLRPNGKILVSIPNIAHISVRLELLQGSFIYEPMGTLDNTHLQYVTLNTFMAYANEAGYSAKLIDYTANDIPQEIIEKQLANQGLSANKKFWDTTKKIEARAYQFKFVLKPSVGKNAKPQNNIDEQLRQKPLQYRDNIITDYRQQLEGLDNHSKEQAKIIDHYKQLSERLARENEELVQAIKPEELAGHRLIQHYRSGAGQMKRKIFQHKNRKGSK